MVGESCFEGVLCKTDVGLRWFVVICFDGLLGLISFFLFLRRMAGPPVG